MALKVAVAKKQDGVFLVSPVGSIDSYTYVEFEERMDEILGSPVKVIVVDMEGVDFISSRGISAIFKAKKAVEKAGGSFLMLGLQPQVKQVFEIIKVLPTMKVFESVEALDAYLAKIQRGGTERQEEP
jgi:anti-anti-sigma factor